MFSSFLGMSEGFVYCFGLLGTPELYIGNLEQRLALFLRDLSNLSELAASSRVVLLHVSSIIFFIFLVILI